MNLKDFEVLKRGTRGFGYACTNSRKAIAYPWWSVTSRRVYLSVANTYTLSDSRGTFNVIVAMRQRSTKDEKDIEIWCGDQFLEGRRLNADQARERCRTAASGLPLAQAIEDEMFAAFNTLPTSAACDYWKLKRSKPAKLCEHTQHVLAELFTPEDQRDLESTLNHLLAGAEMSQGSDSPGAALDSYLFRVPVLFEGDRGSGKTFEAHAFARRHELPLIELPGHEGVEAMDLLGTYTPMADRTLVWKDGPMSQAFRRASKGQPTVLLIDELLRIPTRQQSVLLTALSPIDGCYRVRTGRIVNVEDGVGEEEVLSCKVEHLAIVATTNVGADYALDNLDPAIAERWVIMRKDTTEEGLRESLSDVVGKKKFTSPVINRLVRFFNKAKELRTAGQIARIPTTRTLVRAVELAQTETEIGTMLLNQALLWVERDLDGYPIKEQIESLRIVVNAIFPGSTGRVLL